MGHWRGEFSGARSPPGVNRQMPAQGTGESPGSRAITAPYTPAIYAQCTRSHHDLPANQSMHTRKITDKELIQHHFLPAARCVRCAPLGLPNCERRSGEEAGSFNASLQPSIAWSGLPPQLKPTGPEYIRRTLHPYSRRKQIRCRLALEWIASVAISKLKQIEWADSIAPAKNIDAS